MEGSDVYATLWDAGGASKPLEVGVPHGRASDGKGAGYVLEVTERDDVTVNSSICRTRSNSQGSRIMFVDGIQRSVCVEEFSRRKTEVG
jgi:hypothetical protein